MSFIFFQVQHREKKFSCTICHKAYSHETGYLKHMASHPENENLKMRLWSCPVCLKVFTKETYLERHMEMKLDPDHTRELVDFRKRLIERQNREQEVALLNEQQRRQRIAAGEPLPGTSGLHNLMNAAPTVEQRDRLQNSLLNNDLNSGLGLSQNGQRSQLTPINLGASRMSPTDFGGHRGSEPVSPLPLHQRENGPVNNGSVASPRNNSSESPQSSSFLPSNFNSTIQSVVNNIMSSQPSYMGRASTPLDSNGMLPPSSTPSRLSVDTHSPLGSPPPNRQISSPHPNDSPFRHPPISCSLSAECSSMGRSTWPSLNPTLSHSIPSFSAPLNPHTSPMTLPHAPVGPGPVMSGLHGQSPFSSRSMHTLPPHFASPRLPSLPSLYPRRASGPLDQEEIVSALQSLADSMPEQHMSNIP